MPAAAPAVRVGPGGGGPHPAQVELQTHLQPSQSFHNHGEGLYHWGRADD